MATSHPQPDTAAAMDRARAVLRERFGHDAFLPGQEQALRAVFEDKNLLVVMPTGSGKSLLYQLPALLDPRLTLVVSPLIALMKDQVDDLRARGIAATFINSSLGFDEQRERMEACARGEVQLLYVAPERFRSPAFCDMIKEADVGRMAVDEAHCISAWGHDFRPDYRRLKQLREHIGSPRVSALTATATPRVQQDIVQCLGLRPDEAEVLVRGFDRPNLALSVVRTRTDAAKDEFLTDFVRSHKGSGIVYVGTRKAAEQVAASLRPVEPTARAYHAGLEPHHRSDAQEAFLTGQARVIVATIAFGMGIDKPDVRFVVHYHYPSSVEGYYQEIGRAGRDGLPSECVLLFSQGDRRLRDFFIDLAYPSREIVEEVYYTLWEIPDNPVLMTYADIAALCEGKVRDGQVGATVRLLSAAGVVRGLVGDPLAVVTLHHPGDAILAKVRGPMQQRVMEALAVAVDLETPSRYEVSLEQVCRAAALSEEQVRRALAALARDRHIGYEPPFRGRGVEKLVSDPPPFDEVNIDWDRHDLLRGLEEEKLEAMEAYIHTRQCRRAHVVRYFGEDTDLACGMCDRCTKPPEPKGEGILAAEPMVAPAVLVCIAHLPFPLGAQKVAKVLTGSRARDIRKWNIHHNPAHGFLNVGKDHIHHVIDQLLKEGYLDDEPGQFGPVLALSRSGQDVADATELDELAEAEAPQPHHAPPEPHTTPRTSVVAHARPADDQAVRRAALQCVALLRTPVGVGKVAGVVTGSAAEWVTRLSADQLPCYDTVAVSQKDAQETIKALVAERLLRLDRRSQYPVLVLTDLGEQELARVEPGPPAVEPTPEPPAVEPSPPAPPRPKAEPVRGKSQPVRGLSRALDTMVARLLTTERSKAKELVSRLMLFHPAEIARRLNARYDETDSEREQSRAVWAAGELCGEHGLVFLLHCAGAENVVVRGLAASALAKVATRARPHTIAVRETLEQAYEVLTFLLNDTAPQVRQHAEKALAQLDDDDAAH